MLTVNVKADFGRIDIDGAYNVMFEAVKAATAVYYEVVMDKIPHDSGFLSRAFNPLRRYTGRAVRLPPLSSRTTYNHSKTVKVRRTAANAESFTRFTFGRRKDDFGVTFTNDIVYWLVNDIYGHPSGAYPPWRINEAAFKAALQFLEKELAVRLDHHIELSLSGTGGASLSSRQF